MAHLALTIDPDLNRRKQFIARALANLSSLPGINPAQAEVGDLAIVWACGISAPQSHHLKENDFGLLLGYAVDDTGKWLNAQSMQARWNNPQTQGEQFDGYYTAVAYSKTGGLTLGVDLLGVFPMYHANCGEALVAATSPKLFAAHPQFHEKFNPRGLTGIFLTNGLVGGETLLEGVKRLGSGCQLRWNVIQGTREVETYRFAPHDRYLHFSGIAAREMSGAALLNAIRRHRPPQSRSTLMLSGGLDSRLMAGYLHSEGIIDSAVCLGNPTDFEVQVGTKVAAALHLKVQREESEPSPGEFLRFAQRTAGWEHLSAGFSSVDVESAGAVAGQAAPMVWSGFAIEDVMAADSSWFDATCPEKWSSPEYFFAIINRWGLPPDVLKTLLRSPMAAEWIWEQREAFRCQYEQVEESPLQRIFHMKLATRIRFHIGGSLHRISFHSWPLLPFLDRRLLEVQFNLPGEMLWGRRLEKALLLHEFPSLAAIPREHNSFYLGPLGSLTPLQRKMAVFRAKARQWYWQQWRKIEPRGYYRAYDLNSPSWRAVRMEAEKYRDRLDGWLERKIVNGLLPPAQVELKLDNPFAEGSPRRMLLGLLLWSAQHPDC